MSKKKSPPYINKASFDPGLSGSDISLLRMRLRQSLEEGLRTSGDSEAREYCRALLDNSSQIEAMMRGLTALGFDIHIHVTKRPSAEGYARIYSSNLPYSDSTDEDS